MNRSYRIGNSIVVVTLVASFAACLATVGMHPSATRAGQDLGGTGFALGQFRLIERSGRVVTDADLANRVWVASFIFTHCPLSCPRISSVMKGLQGRFEGTGVLLVSLTVDPDRDRPDVLAEYARRFDADPAAWWFLTGSKPEVVDLITRRFKLGLQATGDADQAAGAEAFSHSDRVVLVDGGKVVGYFDSSDPKALDTLVSESRRRAGPVAPSWVRRLPAVNATLNGTCALLLTLGWVFIRTGNIRSHALTMIVCVAVSVLFLACYLLYHFEVGSVPFQGAGSVRIVYFTTLLSHTLLATFGVVPLVSLTLLRALYRQFDRHARIARVTFPIWLYVSVTGVIIYLMLYHWPMSETVSSF